MKMTRMSTMLAGATALCAVAGLERKDADLLAEIKKSVGELGKDFEAFKDTNKQRWSEIDKKKSADVLLEDKLTRIGDNVDKLVEQKAALEKSLEQEKKEREELELRIERGEISEKGDHKKELELKQFNLALSAHLAERGQKQVQVDMKGMEDYKKAFEAFCRKNTLTPEEQKALAAGSDPDGGFLLPASTQAGIVKKLYETSEMRSICDVMTIGTDGIEGIEDLGEAGAAYAGERSTSGDSTTPQVGKWAIGTWIIDTEPKITQKLLDDANVDVEAWLGSKVGDKFGRFENSEFVVGASKIRGITSYPMLADSGSGVAWGSFGYVPSGASGAFASSSPADALFDLVGALKNGYLPGASWVTKRSVITAIRKFKEATTLAYIWQPGLQQGQPERLLGYPVNRMEDMPTIAANSYSMAFGDFRQGYQILDRQGMRTLRDPFTAKPYVKFYTTKRVGGGAKNFEAVKFMKFATS